MSKSHKNIISKYNFNCYIYCFCNYPQDAFKMTLNVNSHKCPNDELMRIQEAPQKILLYGGVLFYLCMD